MKRRLLYTISLITGLVPMLTGTIIFWVWFFYPKFASFAIFGLQLIVISIPICLVGLILAFTYKRENKLDIKSKRKANRSILLTISNIPLAMIYVYFALYLMATERITIVNNSESEIENVQVLYADSVKKIERLDQGQSQTVWLYISSEDPIYLTYTQFGKKQKQIIDGYPIGGSKYDYPIKFTDE